MLHSRERGDALEPTRMVYRVGICTEVSHDCGASHGDIGSHLEHNREAYMAYSAWPLLAVVPLLLGTSACASGPPDFALDAGVSSNGTDPAAQTPPAAAGASISVGFASTPPPGEYRFVRLHESGRADIKEVLTVNGPGPWLTYEGVVSVPSTTARALVQAADLARLTTAPPSVPGAPCVLALASATALVWRGCAEEALARRVMADVPALTPAAQGAPCSRPLCEVRLVRSAPARPHERYGQVAQDIVIDASGGFSCAIASPDRRETSNVLRVVRGRVRAADAGALFDWLSAAIPGPAGPRAADDGLAASGVVARGPGGAWTRVAAPQASATWTRWARIAARLPPACRLPDLLTSSADERPR